MTLIDKDFDRAAFIRDRYPRINADGSITPHIDTTVDVDPYHEGTLIHNRFGDPDLAVDPYHEGTLGYYSDVHLGAIDRNLRGDVLRFVESDMNNTPRVFSPGVVFPEAAKPVNPLPPSVIQASGCLDYNVQLLNEAEFLLLVDEEEAAGIFDPAGLRIIIRSDVAGRSVPHQKVREVLTHEWLHLLFSAILVDEGVEEAIVTGLTPVLIEALRRNPTLVQYITGGLE